jgi:hypothetical protein
MKHVHFKEHLLRWESILLASPLPVNNDILLRAQQQTGDPAISSRTIADTLSSDPPLAWHIYNDAAKRLAKGGTQPGSLEHAITVLGMQMVKKTLDALPVLPPREAHELYRRTMAITQHAAWQAHNWSMSTRHWPVDNMYTLTLLAGVPLWLLSFHAEKEMLELIELRKRERRSNQHQEVAIFGVPLRILCDHIAHQLHLPEEVQQAWHLKTVGTMRTWLKLARAVLPDKSTAPGDQHPSNVLQLMRKPAFGIALAHRFCLSANWDWYSRQTRRLQYVLAAVMDEPLGWTIAETHRIAAAFSQATPNYPAPAPAAALLGFYREGDPFAPETSHSINQTTLSREEDSAAIATPHSTPAATADVSTSSHALEQLLGSLKATPPPYNGLSDLLPAILKALHNQLGLERCAAMLYVAPQEKLKTYFNLGADSESALKKFDHPVKPQDIFGKLMAKPASVRLAKDNYAKIWPVLPGGFKQAIDGDEFFIMSIFSGNKPVGFIYADNNKSHQPLTDEQYRYFKLLCSAATSCLSQISPQAKQNNS